MSEEMTKKEIEGRLAKYYAWKLVILQTEKTYLPEARREEDDFERWYGAQARSENFDLAPNMLIAMARFRRSRLEAGLQDLRDRFSALFGRHRLPTT